VAITKVIGRDLDSIVVDTEKTGKDCIQFMKDQVLAIVRVCVCVHVCVECVPLQFVCVTFSMMTSCVVTDYVW